MIGLLLNATVSYAQEIMNVNEEFFDIAVPIKKIIQDNNWIFIKAQGKWNNQVVETTFKIKKNLVPFFEIIKDDKGGFANILQNVNASWYSQGSCLFFETQTGLNFANMLLTISKQSLITLQKSIIIFDTALISSHFSPKKITTFQKNTHDEIRQDIQIPVLKIENFPPNYLYFKVEYISSSNLQLKFQMIIGVDLDRGYLIFSEKDIEMRKALYFLLKK